MLFNSYLFIFIFLPITLLLFFLTAQFSQKWALCSLFLASLFFYAWNNFNHVYLLLLSILINYIISKNIIRSHCILYRKIFLWIGISLNLLILAYFKYFSFFMLNINGVLHSNLSILNITLPIGISFFTFTQIAFLVDSYRGFANDYSLLNYALFVTYFPHLIAGPIIHHKEVMPQFNNKKIFIFSSRNIFLGLIIFTIGLFKKVVLADYLSNFVYPIFDIQASYISMLDAWIGAISYSFELYFDFSGYSDMAIGLSLLIGIKLPINFYSPYRAVNIIEFWRRWNMTLSRFLKNYLYIPLGGNRKGIFRRYSNLMITMILGGLWHGANWTFVVWGSLHGLFLCINHGWIFIKKYFHLKPSGILYKNLSRLITFFSVVVAWVYFRAPDLSTANKIVNAMFFGHCKIPLLAIGKVIFYKLNVCFSQGASAFNMKFIFLFVLSLYITLFLPNVYQFLYQYRPALFNVNIKKLSKIWLWKPIILWNILFGILFVLDILFIQSSRIFLYFNF